MRNGVRQEGEGGRKTDRRRRRREQEKRLAAGGKGITSCLSSAHKHGKASAPTLRRGFRPLGEVEVSDFYFPCTWMMLRHHYLLLAVVITVLQNIKRKTSGQSISLLSNSLRSWESLRFSKGSSIQAPSPHVSIDTGVWDLHDCINDRGGEKLTRSRW